MDKGVSLSYPDLLPEAQNIFLSYKDYQNAFTSFFKKSGISNSNCEFILPKIKQNISIIALCLDTSGEDTAAFALLKPTILENYAIAVKQSDINEITPLGKHEDHEVQLYADGVINKYYMLINENGLVFNTAKV